MWGGLWKEAVVGPLFFDGTVTEERYLRMLQDEFLPELETFHVQKKVCIFMQDGVLGVLSHWYRAVCQMVDQNFPEGWVGRGSPNMPWPPCSLFLCDFALVGVRQGSRAQVNSEHHK